MKKITICRILAILLQESHNTIAQLEIPAIDIISKQRSISSRTLTYLTYSSTLQHIHLEISSLKSLKKICSPYKQVQLTKKRKCQSIKKWWMNSLSSHSKQWSRSRTSTLRSTPRQQSWIHKWHTLNEVKSFKIEWVVIIDWSLVLASL